ncbi:MAG: hypothetical protein HY834_12510 [Devosia nanyangense]|uniref:Uncharacterized protein n=1 Tax=Devosia nanyangense TaxID=1228055 RepID=A0A933L2V2_9HYPH|nr:hypothetical protein [Devosia nanyangense]
MAAEPNKIVAFLGELFDPDENLGRTNSAERATMVVVGSVAAVFAAAPGWNSGGLGGALLYGLVAGGVGAFFGPLVRLAFAKVLTFGLGMAILGGAILLVTAFFALLWGVGK